MNNRVTLLCKHLESIGAQFFSKIANLCENANIILKASRQNLGEKLKTACRPNGAFVFKLTSLLLVDLF